MQNLMPLAKFSITITGDFRYSFLKFVDGLFGPHSENFKINKFNSKFHTPGTSGVDAFASHWAGENDWLVPPLNLVNRVIKHCLACRAFGTLVVPEWESFSLLAINFSK